MLVFCVHGGFLFAPGGSPAPIIEVVSSLKVAPHGSANHVKALIPLPDLRTTGGMQLSYIQSRAIESNRANLVMLLLSVGLL